MLTPAIWTAMYVKDDLPSAIRTLHHLGWQAFECSTEHIEMIDADPDAAARITEARLALAELGAIMPQAHAKLSANVAHPDPAVREADLATLERHLHISARLGVRYVVIHPGRGEGHSTPEELQPIIDRNKESFTRLGDVAGELGLMIGIENMPKAPPHRPQRYGAETEELLALLEELDHAALGITLDTDHATTLEAPVGTTILQYGRRICATHISDSDGRSLSHRTPGYARINWPDVMAALRAIGYAGIFNLEIPGERHPLPELQALKVRHAREVTELLVNLPGKAEHDAEQTLCE